MPAGTRSSLRPGLRSQPALGVMRSRHGATAIPSHDPECGKSAIAANNQRQSRQQHAASQRGIWRRIPAGMTGEGLGAGPGVQRKKKEKKPQQPHAPICFGFCPSLQSCLALPGFRVKPWVLQEGGTGGAGMAALSCWHRGQGQLCCPLSHLSHAPFGIWDTGTRPSVARPFCLLDSTEGHGQ